MLAEKPGMFERLLREATVLVVRDILWSSHKVSRWEDGFIKPVIESLVTEAIKGRNLDALIDNMVKEKVKALLDKIQ